MVRSLESPPAFGFQTGKVNADDYYKSKIAGFNAKRDAQAKTNRKVSNLVKILGYIPALGTFIGIGRIAVAISENKNNKWAQIARGVMEIAGLGLILFAIDVVITFNRQHSLKALNANS